MGSEEALCVKREIELGHKGVKRRDEAKRGRIREKRGGWATQGQQRE